MSCITLLLVVGSLCGAGGLAVYILLTSNRDNNTRSLRHFGCGGLWASVCISMEFVKGQERHGHLSVHRWNSPQTRNNTEHAKDQSKKMIPFGSPGAVFTGMHTLCIALTFTTCLVYTDCCQLDLAPWHLVFKLNCFTCTDRNNQRRRH